MASGSMSAPQKEQPNPMINGALGWRIPQKPTNSLELDREPLSCRPNEGLHSSLDALTLSQSMAVEGRPQKAGLRGLGPVIVALTRAWSSR